jgi:hypothetical protein
VSDHVPIDGERHDYVPLPHRANDWTSAQTMIEGLELRGPLYEEGIVAANPEDPITIVGGDGLILFAVRDDGTVEAPDLGRLPEAAVIFWRNVLELARLSGLTIKPPFEGMS